MTSAAIRMLLCIPPLATILVGVSPPASAEAVADFYKGKRISLLVGSDAGGGYDVSARLVSRHLGRFIPGNPDVLVQNMPGAEGCAPPTIFIMWRPKTARRWLWCSAAL